MRVTNDSCSDPARKKLADALHVSPSADQLPDDFVPNYCLVSRTSEVTKALWIEANGLKSQMQLFVLELRLRLTRVRSRRLPVEMSKAHCVHLQ